MILSVGCDNLKIEDPHQCPAIGTKGNNYNASTDAELDADENKYNATDFTQDTHRISIPAQGSARQNDRKLNLPDNDQLLQHKAPVNPEDGGVSTWLGFFIPMALVLTIVCWVFYAYRNPHTKSGQLLIQVRFIKKLAIFSRFV